MSLDTYLLQMDSEPDATVIQVRNSQVYTNPIDTNVNDKSTKCYMLQTGVVKLRGWIFLLIPANEGKVLHMYPSMHLEKGRVSKNALGTSRYTARDGGTAYIIIYKADLSLSIQVNFNLTGQKRLFYI